MSKKTRTTLLKYGAALVVGALIAYAALRLRDFTGAEPPAERFRMLCDACTFPGVFLTLTAALIALSNEGAFLGLGYVFGHAIKALIPGMGIRDERYADYRERRTGADRVKGYGFIFHVGLFYFALAILFLFLFYRYFE